MDPNSRLYYLFRQQLIHKNSAAEKQELLSLMANPENEAQVKDLLNVYWQEFDVSNMPTEPVFQPGQGQDILNSILQEYICPTQAATGKPAVLPRILAAAAAIVVITCGTWLYMDKVASLKTTSSSDEMLTNDIAPGKQGATLTLANGKTIKLSAATNGKLATEAGVVITKSANGQLIYELKPAKKASSDFGAFNTLSTAKGETYQVRLPDSSTVWLNAASSITYTTNLLTNGKRMVQLQGEAYFQIAKNKKYPFVVKSKNQQVEVLGTSFNVNAYADEPIVETTLLEGSIRISSIKIKAINLKPGEQALHNGHAIKVGKANLESIMDWKNGEIVLNDVDLKTALRKIARWYNIEVVYDPTVPDHIKSGGWISRDTKLSEVLALIEKSGQVKFKLDERRLRVMK
ncbi:FecR domain-containing protein [Olivibacter sp. SA151]|uniref:FecR family protein n=1 Tax=Olivibacter jilunii TaxID=985016 RepID=UPI003F15AEAD